MKERLYEYKTIRSQGAILSLFREKGEEVFKFHSWDGPAIEPIEKDCELPKTFYLYGNLLEEEEWKEMVNQREGLPFYKNPSLKHLISDYRN